MNKTLIIQGRKISEADIKLITTLINDNPCWHRTRLSMELCELWNWRTNNGRLKDMACRTFLLKLERKGKITLPTRQRSANLNSRRNREVPDIGYSTELIQCPLGSVTPVSVTQLSENNDEMLLFRCLLARYHYLGFKNSFGENLRYLIRDRKGRPLACLLFGAAAWKTACRDRFIGWTEGQRKAGLRLIVNNSRFLVLPWVKVPNLASHVLSRVSRRIRDDWIKKYSHPIHLLETFIERDRFRGSCYRAANWIDLGSTEGRGRNDRSRSLDVPVKDILVYPLHRHFRRELIHAS
jgi:hypothetical protein